MIEYIVSSLLLLHLSGLASPCNPKYYGKKAFVCVCDSKYCDTLDESHNVSLGEILMYESDASRHRLHKTRFNAESLLTGKDDLSDVRIKINRTDLKQSIIGFGGAFTDSSGYNLNGLPELLQQRLVKDYFGKDGLEYNMGRVPIAGSDFSNRPYTYADSEGDFELRNFSLTRDDYEYKIPFILDALAIQPNLKLIAAAWSAPAWMKTNRDFVGLGILKGEPGSIYWKIWANYFVRFLDEYRENDVEFWGLSPINEPMTGFIPGHKWNTMGFSPWMLRDFIKLDLEPALRAAGYGKDKLKLLIFDHNTDYVALFAKIVLSDPEVASYASGIAFHWYDEHHYENLDETHRLFPDHFLLSTEASEGWSGDVRGASLGNWTRAETYAEDIIEGLNHWSTGWIDWNLILDPQGGPNWVDNVVDAPIIVNETAGEYYKQPMFYSLGHFSKYLPPGSVRVGHEVITGKENVKMTSFITPRDELVVIILNTNDQPVSMTIEGLNEAAIKVNLGPHSIRTIIAGTK